MHIVITLILGAKALQRVGSQQKNSESFSD